MYHSLVCVEPSLHLRDKFPLGAGESPFSLSGSIRYILVRIFVSVNQGQHHSLVSFWFWNYADASLKVWEHPLLSEMLKTVSEDLGIRS